MKFLSLQKCMKDGFKTSFQFFLYFCVVILLPAQVAASKVIIIFPCKMLLAIGNANFFSCLRLMDFLKSGLKI